MTLLLFGAVFYLDDSLKNDCLIYNDGDGEGKNDFRSIVSSTRIFDFKFLMKPKTDFQYKSKRH